jgi:hypothetical protein
VVLDLRESFGPLAGNVGELLGRPPFEWDFNTSRIS